MPNNEIAMAELQSKIWAMEPRRLSAFFVGLAHYASYKPKDEQAVKVSVVPSVKSTAGVAVIPINGILMNKVPAWLDFFDIEATAYGDIVSMVKAAVISDDVERIHLQINSPGGTVAGGHEASEAIFNARKTKKVTAHINDLGASAAYWLAAQAESISAGPNAEVGSIGIFSVWVDSSKAAEDEGIKVHIVRSGDHKGMGVPGVGITEEQLKSEQAVVDGMADNFVAAVARGRGKNKSEVRKLATGETWIAKTAKANGLIDTVVGAAKSNSITITKGSNMETIDKNVEEPKVDIEKIKAEAGKEAVTEDRKRLSAMQAEFDGDLEFAVEQFSKGATLIEAKAAYADVLKGRLVEANKEKPEPKKATGAEPIGHSEGGPEAVGDFLTQAKALAKEKGIKLSQAIRDLKRQDPELFAASQANTRK